MTCETKLLDHTCTLDDDAEPHACYCGYVWPQPETNDIAAEFYWMIATSAVGAIILAGLLIAAIIK